MTALVPNQCQLKEIIVLRKSRLQLRALWGYGGRMILISRSYSYSFDVRYLSDGCKQKSEQIAGLLRLAVTVLISRIFAKRFVNDYETYYTITLGQDTRNTPSSTCFEMC